MAAFSDDRTPQEDQRKRFLIYPNRMADDSNFVALLNSLLSIDNDARTAAEVSEVAKVKKSIKLR
jgi:hypothetical protein